MSKSETFTKVTYEYLMAKSKSDLADEYLRLCDTNSGLREGYERFLEVAAERDKLAEKLNDWSETYNKIIEDGTCASDEYHCACVPALREEVKKLRDALITIGNGCPWIDDEQLLKIIHAALETKPC